MFQTSGYHMYICRCGGALKELYFVPLVQHMVRGISMQELLGHKAIFQPGVARKVCVWCVVCVCVCVVCCVCVCVPLCVCAACMHMFHVSVCLFLRHCGHSPICSVSALTLISAGKHTTTLDYLLQSDVQYNIVLDTIALTDEVVEHQAIVSTVLQHYTSARYDENVLCIDEVWNLAGNM